MSPPHRRDKASLRRPPAILENQIYILLIIESKSISTPMAMMLELPEVKHESFPAYHSLFRYSTSFLVFPTFRCSPTPMTMMPETTLAQSFARKFPPQKNHEITFDLSHPPLAFKPFSTEPGGEFNPSAHGASGSLAIYVAFRYARVARRHANIGLVASSRKVVQKSLQYPRNKFNPPFFRVNPDRGGRVCFPLSFPGTL